MPLPSSASRWRCSRASFSIFFPRVGSWAGQGLDLDCPSLYSNAGRSKCNSYSRPSSTGLAGIFSLPASFSFPNCTFCNSFCLICSFPLLACTECVQMTMWPELILDCLKNLFCQRNYFMTFSFSLRQVLWMWAENRHVIYQGISRMLSSQC